MKNKYIVWLLSIGIFIAIIFIGLIARKGLSFYDKKDLAMASTIIDDTTYNKSIKETYNLDGYLIYLQEYIRVSEISLNSVDEARKDHLFKELFTIANLERKNNIKYMSIDGREIAISLLKNIYGIYGVDITFSLDGDIQKVNDPLGNSIYHKAVETLKARIQIINFTIVVFINLILFAISIFINRKNKITLKDVNIYGLNKKKYA